MSSQKQSGKYSKKRRNAAHAPHGFGGVRPSKGLGQNFLKDEDVIESIVKGSGASEDALVVEIGPGTGVLTMPLAERSGHLVAVEIDEELIEPLRVKTFGMRAEIINEDILKLDLENLINSRLKEHGLKHVRIVGNLPYYITTPIIMKLLETCSNIDSITVMMQKEVGDRIAAEPGGRAAGAITYSVHYYAKVSKIADVGRECFYPVPKVDSVVLRLDIRPEPYVQAEDPDYMFGCIKAGFSQRRKTLLNSLSAMKDLDKEKIGDALDATGIDRSRRAETLSLAEFAALSDRLKKL